MFSDVHFEACFKSAYAHLCYSQFQWLVGWLCLTSHRQRSHLETAPQFTVPCEGRVAR